MKKILLVVFVLGAVILTSGCIKKKGEEGTKQGAKEEKGGIISSIKDAVGLGKKMECTYKFKVGDEESISKVYIEGKKYRSENEVMGKKNVAIFDGETMYTWSLDDKKGTKWSKSCMNELDKGNKPEESEKSMPEPNENEIKDASEAFEDAMDVKCNDVSSIDFSVPSDITFSDMCQQLKEMQDKLKNMGDNLPKGVNIPSGEAEIPSGVNIPGGMGQ